MAARLTHMSTTEQKLTSQRAEEESPWDELVRRVERLERMMEFLKVAAARQKRSNEQTVDDLLSEGRRPL